MTRERESLSSSVTFFSLKRKEKVWHSFWANLFVGLRGHGIVDDLGFKFYLVIDLTSVSPYVAHYMLKENNLLILLFLFSGEDLIQLFK